MTESEITPTLLRNHPVHLSGSRHELPLSHALSLRLAYVYVQGVWELLKDFFTAVQRSLVNG